MASWPPAMRLNSVDLPTLGRPTMATSGQLSLSPRSDGRGLMVPPPAHSFVAVSQFAQLARVVGPALVDAHEQLQMHRHGQKVRNLLARARADLANHAPALAHHDALVRVLVD